MPLTIHLGFLMLVIGCVVLGIVAALVCVILSAPRRNRNVIAQEREAEDKREQATERLLRDDILPPKEPK